MIPHLTLFDPGGFAAQEHRPAKVGAAKLRTVDTLSLSTAFGRATKNKSERACT